MSMSNDMAFPVLDRSQTPNGTEQLGLTKREYFAAIAMQGWIACGVCSSDEECATNAVAAADALLKELSK